tara:strand:+ start:69716 stop:71419 length:1704 start_codon:yes stop_codon:yes gene_type:complete
MMNTHAHKAPDCARTGKHSSHYRLGLYVLICLLTVLSASGAAYAQLFSTAQVHVTGLDPKSTAFIEVENSGQTQQAIVGKKGDVNLAAQFPENVKTGISSGVNYTLTYELPYRDQDERRRALKNVITFSFSSLTNDVIILGQASDTALIEYASGTSNMKNTTASASGIFKNIFIQNLNFKKNSAGTAFVIITNTEPETGAPLAPVYIEASFSIAKPASKATTKESMKRIFSSVSKGEFTMPDSKIHSAWGVGLQTMAMELTTNTMALVAPIGAFFDAYALNRTIGRIQVLQAETTQRHMPSVSMCTFPSLTKSVARGSFNARATAQIFAKYMQDYDLQHVDSAGAMISNNRERDYINKFRTYYCNDQQNGKDGLSDFCGTTPTTNRVNYDVNFPSFFSEGSDNPVNFTGSTTALSFGEMDLFQLTKNLYDSNLRPLKENIFQSADGSRPVTEIRSLQAIRNVAKNSFANLVGGHANMYTMGGTTDTGASYEDMMEDLTKKKYQDPAFYVNLYDNPENVMRQKSAIKAVQLMQGWDIVKALHRREMLLAMLLELKLRNEQKQIEISAN